MKKFGPFISETEEELIRSSAQSRVGLLSGPLREAKPAAAMLIALSRVLSACAKRRSRLRLSSRFVVPIDRAFLASLLKTGLLKGPILEVGSQAIDGQGGNTEAACRAAGLEWEGVDLVAGPGVDRVLDMTDTQAVSQVEKRWASVLLFNILEHVYDPVTVLRNSGVSSSYRWSLRGDHPCRLANARLPGRLCTLATGLLL